MSKTKFKYLIPLIALALCVNFLLFTTGSIYLNKSSLSTNQSQNGPQKRSFSSAHNFQIKLKSENEEKDLEIEEEIEDEQNTKHNGSSSYFNLFQKTISLKDLVSIETNFSKPSHYTSLNALYIVFRVFRL